MARAPLYRVFIRAHEGASGLGLAKRAWCGAPMIPRYRADIDGLRAVAVLAVVLFHVGSGLVSGGYVGVDIFS
jgi:hypothetical protein